jgi:hypothetical protein
MLKPKRSMKHILPLLIFMLLSTWSSAQCISGDCKNGNGILILPDGSKYAGHFTDGQIKGVGTCYYTDGSKYRGEWNAGKPDGQGIKTYKNGVREEGEWRKGKFIKTQTTSWSEIGVKGNAELTPAQTGCVSGDCYNGTGIYIYPSGAVYIGEFRNGEIQGIGVCYYSDGSKYQGEWMNRYPEGNGTKTYADGSKRTGSWKRGQPVDAGGKIVDASALAKEKSNDGTAVQSGCLSGDCVNGQGVFAYPDGSRYEGYFRNGKPNAGGTFFYPNKDKYVGNFRNGLRNGNGTLIQANGATTTGEWKEGEFVGKGATTKMGCIEGDCANGYGTYVFRDGPKYIGTFKNHLPDGKGVVYYPNSERYEGDMANGAFNGYGTLFMEDGTHVNGFWKEGTYLGAKNPYAIAQEDVSSPKYRKTMPDLKVWAVIIGVSAYNHMPVLRYPDDDAYRIFAFLRSPEGGALPEEQIRILVDEDATKRNIKNTMEDIFGKAGPNDLVFFYFSGHGLKGSFLPIDFDGVDNKLYHDEVNDILARSPAKYKLVIADACHSGSLLAMRGDKEPSMLTTYYETLAKAKAGSALLMSSKSEETSLESSGLRQGVFSHFLIRGLKGEADSSRDKIVSVQELFDYVQANVRSYTGNRQSPIMQGDYDPRMTVAVLR